MTAKQLRFGDDARARIRRGVNALADGVNTTATMLANAMIEEGMRYLAGGMKPPLHTWHGFRAPSAPVDRTRRRLPWKHPGSSPS